MSTFHDSPEKSGPRPSERQPQVVVRAGKTFLCGACGTLVEVPAEVVGQLVLAVGQSAPQPRDDNPPPQREPVAAQPLPKPPARPKRPPQPKRPTLVGQTIDGLMVPSGKQLDRALAWVSFHLRILDRQGSELKRLQKLRKDRLSASPLGEASSPHPQASTQQERCAPAERPISEDAGATMEKASPCAKQKRERGPP
ncbi:hypothetical protein [Bremerella sp.]|uniref:hypothetical protein n=1 Tax=Bremerella sp. TaxID=2795602 RepID=UPI00391A22BA